MQRLAERIQKDNDNHQKVHGSQSNSAKTRLLDSLILPEWSPTVQLKPSSVLPEKIPVADKSNAASPSPETSVGTPEETVPVLSP